MEIFNLYANFVGLLYVGPDQMLPIVSTVGGVLGVLLLWWGRLVAGIRKMITRGDKTTAAKE